MSTTKVKLCGMSREEDIRAVNDIRPDYIGFVFFEKSSRYVPRERAAALKSLLSDSIQAVGVFVDSPVEEVAALLKDGIIDIAQLHGHEDNTYIEALRRMTDKPIIQAFKVRSEEDVSRAEASIADHILLDNGAGTGESFDWHLIRNVSRPFFLAGGLYPHNVAEAVREIRPYAVDVSSGIETDKKKDPEKMRAFCQNARA